MVKPNLVAQGCEGDAATYWVVFTGKTDLRFLRILRDGFRHCFVIVKAQDTWFVIDPRADKTDFAVLPYPAHFNLPRYFVGQGQTVVKVPTIKTPPRIAPLVPWSCVETVKRLIGLHRRWILTPYQLYRCLTALAQKG